jgi:hypothetical protein
MDGRREHPATFQIKSAQATEAVHCQIIQFEVTVIIVREYDMRQTCSLREELRNFAEV